MKIGFTGSREGGTSLTFRVFNNLVLNQFVDAVEFHHGCCVGWDEQACNLVGYCKGRNPDFLRIAHPGDWPSLTSEWARENSEAVHPWKKNLDRNRDIVDACDWLIACPRTQAEERRSGTWATIRYARKKGRRITIINPDGTLTEEPTGTKTHGESNDHD